MAQMEAQDGKTYKTAKIGNQTWIAENLDVSVYRNGDTIPQVQDPKKWSSLKTGAWCYYDGKKESGEKYGKLYNWYAVVDPRGLAPEGWHVSTDADWTKLAEFLGGKIGSAARIKSTSGWNRNGNGINETGFNALPGGTRSINEQYSFAGNYGFWWTSTEYDSFSGWNRFLGFSNTDINRSTGWKQFGSSVRCVKGETLRTGSKNGETIEVKKIPKVDTLNNQYIIDRETKNIESLVIGEQNWMSKNLDVSTFQNGDLIPEVNNDADWEKAGKLKQPAWCYYNNDTANEKIYGKLYNWYAVTDKRGLAPKGWHIPNEAEWAKLAAELGGERKAGSKLKSVSGWKENGYGTNETGFTGLPAGFRTGEGAFFNLSMGGYWWSSTESMPATAWYHSVSYFLDYLSGEKSGDKEKGYSVRCIRD